MHILHLMTGLKLNAPMNVMVSQGVVFGQFWGLLRPEERLKQRDITELPCGKVEIFWAAFGQNERTGLVPLDGDPDSTRGGVTSLVFVQLYRAFLPMIVQPGDIFIQDRASVHTAHIVRR